MKLTNGFLVCARKTQNCKDKSIEKECFCSLPSCKLCPNYYDEANPCKGCEDNLKFHEIENNRLGDFI